METVLRDDSYNEPEIQSTKTIEYLFKDMTLKSPKVRAFPKQ